MGCNTKPAHNNTALTQSHNAMQCNAIQSMSVAYLSVLARLLQGHSIDADLSNKLMKLVKSTEPQFHAINGGGQNQARAMLTGALVGVTVGINGIPKRFNEGPNDKQDIVTTALELACQIE